MNVGPATIPTMAVGSSCGEFHAVLFICVRLKGGWSHSGRGDFTWITADPGVLRPPGGFSTSLPPSYLSRESQLSQIPTVRQMRPTTHARFRHIQGPGVGGQFWPVSGAISIRQANSATCRQTPTSDDEMSTKKVTITGGELCHVA